MQLGPCTTRLACVLVLSVAWEAGLVRADVFNQGPNRYSLQFVTVGNPNNAPQFDPNTGLSVGAVGYNYKIAKTELPSSVWIEYANSVGLHLPGTATGTPIWHKEGMNNSSNTGSRIEKITSLDVPSGETQTRYRWNPVAIDGDSLGQPVGGMNFLDTARFVNWLHHGQPHATTLAQSAANYALTNNGVYNLNAPTVADRAKVQPGAKFWIATENEWYKAAYYDPTLNSGTGGYWQYPTRSNIVPDPTGEGLFRGYTTLDDGATPEEFAENKILNNPRWLTDDPSPEADPGNKANYRYSPSPGYHPYSRPWKPSAPDNGGYASEVAWYENSASYYGTYDQGGNLWESMPVSKDGTGGAVRRGGWYRNGGGNDTGVWGVRLSGTKSVPFTPTGGSPTLGGGRDDFQDGTFDDSGIWHDEFDIATWRIAAAAGCGGDLNGDGTTDGADVAIIYNAWGPVSAGNPADINIAGGDGNVDGADLAVVFNCWAQADVGPSAGVPEPASFGVFALGVISLLAARRRSS